jgi:hypothetical protein
MNYFREEKIFNPVLFLKWFLKELVLTYTARVNIPMINLQLSYLCPWKSKQQAYISLILRCQFTDNLEGQEAFSNCSFP